MNESVGAQFRPDLLTRARDLSLQVIEELAPQIRPGMTEKEAKALLLQIQTAKGAPKSWHPPQIRFGANTQLGFNLTGEVDVPLKSNDIFFIDIGPIFDGHEGDVGRAYSVGNDPEMQKCCVDIALIWNEVSRHWKETAATGAELYAFATHSAQKRGWVLTIEKADGHRVSDFPHIAKDRGSIVGMQAHPSPDRWILEIQIKHPTRPFGAFYEDLLT